MYVATTEDTSIEGGQISKSVLNTASIGNAATESTSILTTASVLASEGKINS